MADLLAPLAIVGAGISGRAVVELLRAAGFAESSFTLFDQTPGRGHFHDVETLLKEFRPRTLVVSPGVPLASDWIRKFVSEGGLVTSELEVACAFLDKESVVAVTGSVGKSTTVSLLGEGARRFCPDVFVGGNLGVPLAVYATEVVAKKRSRADWIVLELSSFQLECARNLRCRGAAITSLMRNHLERYDSLESYYETKWKLVDLTEGPLVLNENGGDLAEFARRKLNAGAVSGGARLEFASHEKSALRPDEFARARLVGRHNADNLAVATALARACGWSESFLNGMLEFSGLPHRLQDAGTFGGVRFVNDSKATAIESVLTAIEALTPILAGSAKLWVLLGGKDKKLPWENLASLKGDARLRFAFFGQCGALAREKSELPGEFHSKLGEALRSIKPASGDVVLLSPGGSSLDEFRKFEERGQFFMDSAKEIFS